ncbi:hypothetical protein [Enhygromyxa salina]|uniref:Uncharacterized protein n=1 Tax=Enhygromyxa salina TaxID=215803 RepID=A0A2S9XWX9_9BACT|nr:hypothetical protein [Enhygromyxa salina]PRP97387.1 hypothetical protein ENSA7_67370 [Enhygromyxa salina]
MNAATTVAASTYELPLFAAAPPSYGPTPRGSFVSGLVDNLAWTFNLDTREQALAEQLMFGRPLGALTRHFDVDAPTAARMCRELFVMTGADGREKLFELALRLSAIRAV